MSKNLPRLLYLSAVIIAIFGFPFSASAAVRSWDNQLGAGDGNWSTAANWSGNVRPSTVDAVIFDANSDWSCTINQNVDIMSFTAQSGYTGTINAGSNTLNIAGNWSVASGATFTSSSSTVIFDAGATGITIASGGQTFYNLTFNNAAGAWAFQDAQDIDGAMSVTNGTIDFNGQTLAIAGNLTMGTGSQVVSDADAMDGASISVGGNCDLDGSNGDPLIFKWTGSGDGAWLLDVTGNIDMDYVTFTPASTNTMLLQVHGATATASNVVVAYSNANGGGHTEINATDGTCTDNDHNTNWNFEVAEAEANAIFFGTNF